VHGEGLATLEPPLRHHGPVRGREPAAQAGGVDSVEPLGDADEVHGSAGHDDRLGERTPVGEPRLLLGPADLLVPGEALGTGAAGAHEGRGDEVALAPASDVQADRPDPPGELVARDVRRADVRVVAHPAVPVRPAQPGRLDRHDDAIRRADRVGHLPQGRLGPKGLIEDGAHGFLRSAREREA
jgi:hypothetical protein